MPRSGNTLWLSRLYVPPRMTVPSGPGRGIMYAISEIGAARGQRGVARATVAAPTWTRLARCRVKHLVNRHDAGVDQRRLDQHSLSASRVHLVVLDANQGAVAEGQGVDDEVDRASLWQVIRLIERRQPAADNRNTPVPQALGEVLQVVWRVQDVRVKVDARREASRQRRVGRRVHLPALW